MADLAKPCLFPKRHDDGDQHINLGTGVDLTIRELAEMVCTIVYPEAVIAFDPS